MSMPILRTLLALGGAGVVLAGCGGSTEECAADRFAEPAERQARTQARAPGAAAEAPRVTRLEPTAGERDLDRKPRIPDAEGPPPTELKVEDLIVGDGPAAKSGDTLSVQYVGVLYDNGKQFDASWDNDRKPFRFTLGSGQVIAGWDQGLVGMKVGGRRKLTIPPDLAYGAQGQPPDIPPNSALIFEIDLTDIG
jgi:peptidylprolyl isomerase